MTYKILKKIKYNGEYYEVNAITDIDEKEAQRLIAMNAIEKVQDDEIETLVDNSEIIDNPEAEEETEETDYNSIDYHELKKMAEDRGIKTKGESKDKLIGFLIEDDKEFDELVKLLDAQGIEIPEEATKEELYKLLEPEEDEDSD